MVPCGNREDKIHKVSPKQRFDMVINAIEDYFPRGYPIKACDIEIQNGKFIPTYFLMQKLSEMHADQNMKFYFMLGSDLIPGLIKWDGGQNFIDEVNFVIFERKGYEYVLD